MAFAGSRVSDGLLRLKSADPSADSELTLAERLWPGGRADSAYNARRLPNACPLRARLE